MIKEVIYEGHSAVPTDYESQEGALAVAIGVVPERGAIRGIMPPRELFSLDLGYTVVAVHQQSSYTHYIIFEKDANKLWWCTYDEQSGERSSLVELIELGDAEFYKVTCVGNTLIILTSEGLHYFLWQMDDDGVQSYLDLGDHLPEIELGFALQGTPQATEKYEITFDKDIDEDDRWDDFPEYTSDNENRNREVITSGVLSQVNKFIADYSTNVGRFMFPFFVRYALRLYDGSLVMHSAPILMVTASGEAPFALIHDFSGKNKMNIIVTGMAYDLICVRELNTSYARTIKLWKDIIRSVDIFISQPIYTYNQAGYCKRFLQGDIPNSWYTVGNVVSELEDDDGNVKDYHTGFIKNTFNDVYNEAFVDKDTVKDYNYVGRVELPLFDEDETTAEQTIKDCSSFYFLHSYEWEDFETDTGFDKIVPVSDEYLQSIVAREVMTDDYESHDSLIARSSFVYNNRLHLADVTRRLFKGFNPQSLFCMAEGQQYMENGEWLADPVTTNTSICVYFYIRQEGQEYVVRDREWQTLGYDTPKIYLYYPNINCYKARIYQSNRGSLYAPYRYYEVKMKAHDFLNGSYYFDEWDDPETTGWATTDTELPKLSSDKEREVSDANKVYQTEADDPFFFPLAGVITIGMGRVIGMATTAQALSQGQFGQFPLYAFATDGIWALELSSTGTYSAVQPISRDVCIDTDSITQLDQAVLFITERGIMVIGGSKTQCISDSINSAALFSLSDLPRAEGLLRVYNRQVNQDETLSLSDVSMCGFIDFMQESRMIYDYRHQRVIVYNPSMRYAYVWSLSTQGWGMMYSTLLNGVDNYPLALAMIQRGDSNILVDYTDISDDHVTALVLTRPLTLSDRNVMKTIETVIQRGYFPRRNIQQVLYGSNDLEHWFVVWSSDDRYLRRFSGTPYKAYRLAFICLLHEEESLSGCSIQFTDRRTNKLR